MEPRIQYATTSDGANIAFTVAGDGPPLIWVSSVFASHLTENRQGIETAQILARHFTLARYDGRGSGLSDRETLDFSLEARVLDFEAVRARVGFEQTALLAAGPAGATAVVFAVAHPERVTHLVLASSWASGEALYRESPQAKFVASLESVTEDQWEIVTTTWASRMLSPGDPRVKEFADLYRAAMEPRAALAFRDANRLIDVTDLLARVSMPTLVTHTGESDFTPVSFARKFAALIPEAELVMAETGRGDAPFGTAAERAVVMRFLGVEPDDQQAAPEPSALRTILFTDIVGHTRMMQRLGDEKGREVLREHERITREVLKANGGTEVKTMGDGFMASFGSVTRAVECAIALQKAFDVHNRGVGQGAVRQRADAPTEALSVRVGLNAGEPIEDDGDLFGSTVILASRIAAKAEGGEILASDVVRGLCSGKPFVFADRGEQALRGFEEPVRVWQVSWQT
jgi:class 3 adenylate cyclase/pimeloyl-ACP methyl ester carboxylesterase